MGSPSGTASRASLHRVCSFILIRAGRVGKIILVLGKVKFTGCLEIFKKLAGGRFWATSQNKNNEMAINNVSTRVNVTKNHNFKS